MSSAFRYLVMVVFGTFVAVFLGSSTVHGSTMVLYPNTDPTNLTGSQTTSWVSSLPDPTQYAILRLTDTPPDSTKYLCGQSGTWGYLYGLDNPVNVGQGATSIQVNALAKMHKDGFLNPDDKITLGAYIGGSVVGTISAPTSPFGDSVFTSGCGLIFTSEPTEWRSIAYSTSGGSRWSLADIQGMQMYLGRQTAGSADLIKLFRAYMTVTYDATPNISTTKYRVYADSSSATPGTPLANYDTPASLSTRAEKFRLRMAVSNTHNDLWSAGYGSLKLQYAKKTAASCTAQTGWSDVSASSPGIRFYDNPSVANNATITFPGGDDLNANGAPQTYRESNDATTVTNVTAGKLAGWDFSLQEDAANLGGTYCFKLAPSATLTESSTLLASAEVTTVPAPLGVDIVNSSNVSIASPVIQFSILTLNGQCQQSNAVFGSASQKIQITNGTAVNGWSLSAAPTLGATGLWASGGGDQYDFNDPNGTPAGCSDGGDADNKGGQLTVKPAASALGSSIGCATTGITKGTNAAYSQGVIDAITLLSASSAAQMYCSWDLTSVGLSQMIPTVTPTGAYVLDVTATVVAS
ncbi:MAG: hypothetical protein UY35_C0001G0126 [Candidatus Saccharibacteria bacterium GW2011_GWC2_48_9]|nr:MAG: hypothetical protein UY35_C0001G0126 [Candidatus Saccharibacteria bacterium GW2011_GWC2_48_9]